MYSYPVASALTLGEFQTLTNIRLDDRSIRVRAGIYQEQSAARTGGSNYKPDVDTGTGGIQDATAFYGGALFRKNKSGDYRAVCALDVGASVVKIFYNDFNGTQWGGWSVASNGGASSDNSLSVPTFGYYSFMAVPNGSGGIAGFYVSNGTDRPRFYDTSGGNAIAWKISDLAPPLQASSFAPVAKASGYVNIRSGTMVATWPISGTHYTNDGCFDPTPASGTAGNAVVTGASPDLYWTALTGTLGTALPTVDDFVWFRAAAGSEGNFSGGTQVGVIYDGGDETWFTCLKWYLTGTTAGDLLIHDPGVFKDSHFKVALRQTGLKMAVFSIADHTAQTLTDINGLKFVVSNAKLTAASTMNIRGLVCLGRVPFGCQYAVAFNSSQSTADSPGVLLNPRATSQPLINAGASVNADVYLPMDSRVNYSFDVPVFAPTAAEAALYSTYYRVYRRDPGEAEDLFGNGENGDFYYVGEVNVALYDTGSSNGPGATDRWETVYATFGNDEQAWSKKAAAGTFVDTVTKDNKDFDNRCPGPYNISMPIGASMDYANGLMYVCGARGTGAASRNNAVYVSEKDKPCRFSFVPADTSELDRGIMHSLGDENGLRVASVATSLVGVSSVYCWSDKAWWSVDGLSPIKLSDLGTVAGDSIAFQRGSIFWVTQDLVVVKATESIRGISRYSVHDVLTAVPQSYRKFMSGGMKNGRYYLAHSSAASNFNTKVLVWDDDYERWESDDSIADTSYPASQFFQWVFGSEGRLMYFTKTGQVWEYEREGTANDNGTAIPITVRTGEFTADWEKISIGQAKVVCDSQSATMTVTRTARFPTATKAGTFSCAGGGSETSAWRVDSTATVKSPPRLAGCAVDVNFAASVQHPFSIYSIRLEVERNAGKGARSNQ